MQAVQGLEAARTRRNGRFLRVVGLESSEEAASALKRGGVGLEWPRLARIANSIAAPETAPLSGSRGVHEGQAEVPVALQVRAQGEAPDGVAAEEPAASEAVVDRAAIVRGLHSRFHWRVYCFARKSAGPDAAEEISQEVFVRLLRVRNLERMQIGVSYLLRIAENLLRRRFEKNQRFRSYLERNRQVVTDANGGVAEDPSRGDGVAVHRAGVSFIDADRLERILANLTPEEQSAVRLIVIQGLDYRAAARSLGVRVSTINNWKHRGIAKLRQLIECASPSVPHARQRTA